MILERWTHIVKPGYMQQVIELANSEEWGYEYQRYTARSGNLDRLVTDITFKDMAARDKYWNDVQKTDMFVTFAQKLLPMIVGTEREYFDFVEK